MHEFPSVVAALGDRISTPAPVVLLDVLEENILAMQRFADKAGKALRPHVKTHKSIEITRRQLAAGATGITVGTLGEAEVFSQTGFEDIFLAYPIIAAGAKGPRLRRVAERAKLRVGVENETAVRFLADAFADDPGRIGLVIEIDCGARRSGVDPGDAGALAAFAASLGMRVDGTYTYPGHGGSVGTGEGAARDQAIALQAAVDSLRGVGINPVVVSAGSSPTVAFSTEDVITEVRPGEYALRDFDNLRLGTCEEDEIAFFVASTVVSDHGRAQIIVDAGTKTLAREGNPERGYGQVPECGGALTLLNEYHGFLRVSEDFARPQVGDVVAIVPHHVCPVMNSFPEVILSDRAGRYLGTWQIDAQGQLN